jgi:hypothetical protein
MSQIMYFSVAFRQLGDPSPAFRLLYPGVEEPKTEEEWERFEREYSNYVLG